MRTREQLVEGAAQFFAKPEIQVMHATPDGNYFYDHSKHFGQSHAQTTKQELMTITRTEWEDSVRADKVEFPTNTKELKALCAESNYPKEEWGKLKKDELAAYIKDKLAAPSEETETEDESEESEDAESNDSDEPSQEDQDAYHEATGKNAIHNDRVTGGFTAWKADQE